MNGNDENIKKKHMTYVARKMAVHGYTDYEFRIRQNRYMKYRDITLRNVRKSRLKDEVAQVRNGRWKQFFFGWENEQGTALEAFIIVDVDVLRELLGDGKLEKKNRDGVTSFLPYSMDLLMKNGAVLKTTRNLFPKERKLF